MIGDRHLAADHHAVAQSDAASHPRLACDNAVAADDNVVGNLYEVVDFRAFADHGVTTAAPVNSCASADLNIVVNNYAAELRYFRSPASARDIAESILPNSATGMDDHVVADDGMNDRGTMPNGAIAANANVRSDNSGRPDYSS